MPARKRIGFAASAAADLEEILAHYSGQQVPDVGMRLVGEIIELIEDLAQHPDRGRVVPEFDRDNLREIIRPPFRIVYRRARNRVRIVRVWRSERLLKLP